jgi:hypothetical protein
MATKEDKKTKKNITVKVRDLKPRKDAKGGDGTSNTKPPSTGLAVPPGPNI